VAVVVGIEGAEEGAAVVEAKARHRHPPVDAEDTLDDVARAAQHRLKGICPRGNNKVVIILFRVHNRCLFLMLELY
jgi:hypothetical protein